MSGRADPYKELMDWLSAELNQVEGYAREAAGATDGGQWATGHEAKCECCYWVLSVPGKSGVTVADSRYVDHIARNDPASTLRQVGAAREILGMYRNIEEAVREDPSDRTSSSIRAAVWIVLVEVAKGWGWVEGV